MPPFDFSSLTPKAQPTSELEKSLWRQLSKADQEGNTALATKLANELKTLEGTPISGIRKRIAPIVDKVMSSPAGQALALPGLVAHQTMKGKQRSPEYMAGMGRSAIDQLLLGGYGEAKAKIGEMRGEGDYETLLGKEHEIESKIPTSARLAGTAIGSVPHMVAGSKALQLLKSPISKLVAGPALAGTEAGVTGYLSGSTAEERKMMSMLGASIGLTAGVAVPLSVWGVRSGWGVFWEKMSKIPVPDQWQEAGQSAKQWAMRKVLKSMQRDGFTPGQALKALDELGPDATFADVGLNLRATASVVANKPGKSMAIIHESLNERDYAQFPRIVAKMDQLLESPGKLMLPVIETAEEWPRLMEQSIPITGTLRRYMQTPFGRDAWKQAQKIAQEGDNPTRLPDIDNIIQDPNVKEIQLQLVQWLKKGMDDVIKNLEDTTTKKLPNTEYVRAIQGTRKAFRNEAKFLNKEYGKLLDFENYGFDLQKAHSRGRDAIEKAKMTDKMIRHEMAGLTGPQRRAFKQGAHEALLDKKVPAQETGRDISRTLLGMSNKIRTVFGTRGDKFINDMKIEKTFRETKANIVGGSPTAPRQWAQTDFDAELQGGYGNLSDPRDVTTRIMGKIAKWITTPGEDVSEEAAKILGTKLSPSDRVTLARELNKLLSRGTVDPAILNTAIGIPPAVTATQYMDTGFQEE